MLPGFMSVPSTIDEAPWKAGLRSARANLVPGFVLQCFALTMVLGYYFHGPTREALIRLTQVRADMGVTFAILSTGLFGGLIPLLYLKTLRSMRLHYTWARGAGLTVFWGYKGFEVGLWYAIMAWALGEAADVRTIATKALLDQFVYCPIIAIPFTALVYHWCEHRFNVTTTVADLRAPRWYARRVLPLLFANLGVWLPLVCIIYALPTPLQLPLQNIVLCFFTLMLAHMSTHVPEPPAAE
jgi:hypothetical protein